jgi:hypothetical protein
MKADGLSVARIERCGHSEVRVPCRARSPDALRSSSTAALYPDGGELKATSNIYGDWERRRKFEAAQMKGAFVTQDLSPVRSDQLSVSPTGFPIGDTFKKWAG